LTLAILAGAAYLAFTMGLIGRRDTGPTYQTLGVSQGTLQVTVSATGPVTNPTSIPVSFKTSGLLSEIDVAVGDHVKAGQVLAKQDTTDLQQQVAQSQATLNQQMANEAKVATGPTSYAVAAAQAQVDAAATTLAGAQRSLEATRANVQATNAAAQADVATA